MLQLHTTFDKSLTYITNGIGPRIEPCGTPVVINSVSKTHVDNQHFEFFYVNSSQTKHTHGSQFPEQVYLITDDDDLYCQTLSGNQ